MFDQIPLTAVWLFQMDMQSSGTPSSGTVQSNVPALVKSVGQTSSQSGEIKQEPLTAAVVAAALPTISSAPTSSSVTATDGPALHVSKHDGTEVAVGASVSMPSAPASASLSASPGTFSQQAAQSDAGEQGAATGHLSEEATVLTRTVNPASHKVTQGPKASIARPIMSGHLQSANGVVRLLGQWKMQEKDTVSSPFEYTSDHPVPASWPPTATRSVWLALSGFFRIALAEPAAGGSITVPEKESVLFVGGAVPADAPPTPPAVSVVGLRGSGKNRYGDFQLRGWLAPADGSVKLLRIYTTQKPSKRIATPNKQKTPAKRRSELAAALQRTQRRRSAPKRLAEVGFTGEMTAELRACYNLLESMMKAKAAMFFNDPVDPVALKLPDYFDIVQQPMDYSTVKDKIKRGDYTEPIEFERDMLLVYSNAILYNPVGDPVRAAAEKEREVFRLKLLDMQDQWAEKARKAKAALEAKAKKRERSFDETDDQSTFGDSKKARGQLSLPSSMAFPNTQAGVFSQPAGSSSAASQHAHPLASMMAAASSSGMDPSGMAAMMQVFQAMNGGGVDPGALMQVLQAQHQMRSASGPVQPAAAPAPGGAGVHRQGALQAGVAALTLREKQQLASDVSQLTDAQMDHVVRIVRERMHIPADQTDIELDVDNMDTGTLRALQQYVAACLGRSTAAEKKKTPKRKPRAAPAAKPKATKRKLKDSSPGATIPPPRAAVGVAPSSLPSMSHSLTSLQSQLGIGSAPSLPSGQPSALGGGLAAAMDDALDVPASASSAAIGVTAEAPRPAATMAEPEEAEEFNFDVSGWEDTSAEAAAAGGPDATSNSKDPSKLTSALQASDPQVAHSTAAVDTHGSNQAYAAPAFPDEDWSM